MKASKSWRGDGGAARKGEKDQIPLEREPEGETRPWLPRRRASVANPYRVSIR